MCLIIVSKTARPKEEYIRNGMLNHPDGVGVAWHEKGEVYYKKNLTEDEAVKMAAELPIGYVMHFRWASVGGKDKSLVHPFPVSKDVPLLDEGKAKSVVFHNGTWSAWDNVLVNHLSSRVTLPRGKWSDTRAIAFLVHVHGKGILKLLESAGKFIYMKDGDNWGFGNFIDDEGVSYSNESYKRHIRGGCGTGLDKPNSTTIGSNYSPVGASTHSTTPSTTAARAIPPGSQAWSTPRVVPSQNVVPHSERETMTPTEYAELKSYFEKDLANPGAIQGA